MTGAGPMPDTAGCKTDPLLSKAEPISEAGGTSMEMRLRKGKIRCVAVLRERGMRKKKLKITALQAPRSMKKGWEEMLQALEQGLPQSPWKRLQ